MLYVLKFGGSSVATADKIENAAHIAAKLVDEGNKVVMVVSAKGDTTDDLLNQASEVNKNPSPRELDALITVGEQMSIALMAMCLQRIGVPAVSLCGWQAGVLTDANYGNARILEMHTKRVENELEKGKVVIVAGFQGITCDGDVTTIGRGGSDTSAVALAASLKADKCMIFTDVDGVYSADPRTVPEAMKHNFVFYDEMLEMSSLGAGVLHNRSVELAKNKNVIIKVLSSADSKGGTEVSNSVMEGRKVTGVTCDLNTALLEVRGASISLLPSILGLFAKNDITSDMMTSIDGRLGITVPRDKCDKAMAALGEYKGEGNLISTAADTTVAKVSVVGCGLGGDPQVVARMLRTIRDVGVEVKSIVAGEIKISVLIPDVFAEVAVQAIHKEFFEK